MKIDKVLLAIVMMACLFLGSFSFALGEIFIGIIFLACALIAMYNLNNYDKVL